MNLTNERERGARAKAILTDPLFVDSMNAIRTVYFDAWRNSNAADSKEREHLFALFNAIDEFEGHLSSVLKTGQMAEQQINNS